MDGLKQRIIGALVLISLAVIFVPMVFDEPHSKRTSTSINIPEEPPFPEVDAPESDTASPPAYQQKSDTSGEPASGNQGFRILEGDQQAAAPEDKPEMSSQRDAAPAGEPPASPEVSASSEITGSPETTEEPSGTAQQSKPEFARSLEGAWVVQLGSFGNGDNARRLRDKVRDKGYSSHLQEVVRGDTRLTRVFSGPFAEKARAEAAKRELDEAFSLNSLVTSGDK